MNFEIRFSFCFFALFDFIFAFQQWQHRHTRANFHTLTEKMYTISRLFSLLFLLYRLFAFISFRFDSYLLDHELCQVLSIRLVFQFSTMYRKIDRKSFCSPKKNQKKNFIENTNKNNKNEDKVGVHSIRNEHWARRARIIKITFHTREWNGTTRSFLLLLLLLLLLHPILPMENSVVAFFSHYHFLAQKKRENGCSHDHNNSLFSHFAILNENET